MTVRFLSIAVLLGAVLSCQNGNKAPIPKGNEKLKIAILSFEGFDERLLEVAKNEIEAFYHSEASFLEKALLPDTAYYPPRNRYRAEKLIAWQKAHKPDSVDIILGLTASDISTTKGEYEDWGILGLAYRPGVSCVVSTFRLKKSVADNAHFEERFAKVVLHELGHNLGISHCKSSEICLMQDACGTIKTIDKEEKILCEKCAGQIEKLAKVSEVKEQPTKSRGQ